MSGFSVLKAESPTDASLNDTVNVNPSDLSQVPFVLQSQLPFPIKENEIRAGLLYDVVNSKIIWQKNMGNAYPIASLTKMMVALLTMEDIRASKFSWDDRIKWTRETIVGKRRNRRKVCTEVSYTLRDVFKAAMIASNNECAEQMARYIGNGDLQLTIDRMNARAKELNMERTYFGNPTGLPAPHSMFDNSASPSDLLMLTMEMLKYNEVLEIASMGYAQIENGKFTNVISNHNHLTIDYSGEVDGLKTGYTRRAGFCLVATTAKCEHRLVSIVLGCRGPQIRNEIVRDMINDYYTSIGLDRLGSDPVSPVNAPVENLAQAKDGNYITVMEQVQKIHTVKKGENLSLIASKYKCTTSQLRTWNMKTIRNNHVMSGQKLLVFTKAPKQIFIKSPVNGDETNDDLPLITEAEKKDIEVATEQADTPPTSTIEKKDTQASSKYLYHIVVPGDTLFNIASRYKGATVEQIKSLNKIDDTHGLKPGTKLKVKIQG
jgi:D-alanyl-D-alanine carboxypeptidase